MIPSNSKLLELSGKYKENRAQEPAMFGGKLSFILSLLFSDMMVHIFFTAPTCTTTMITPEPCALNAEF